MLTPAAGFSGLRSKNRIMEDFWSTGLLLTGALWCLATLAFSVQTVRGLLHRRRERERQDTGEEAERS